MPDTYADVDDLVERFDYKPSMSVTQGVENFTKNGAQSTLKFSF